MSTVKLSKNFPVKEFTYSNTAEKNGVDNTMPMPTLKNAILLANRVLQPIRDQHGIVRISSGYRSPEVNRLVGRKFNQ